MPGVMALLSADTLAYGLYANPKSGNQGCIFRDGSTEGWDLHPGGDPYPEATSREILVGYLTRGNAVAYCCAYAGLHPPDARGRRPARHMAKTSQAQLVKLSNRVQRSVSAWVAVRVG